MRNWLDSHIQKVVVSGSMFRWRSVASAVPQGSMFGSVFFHVFISDIESWTESTLSLFAEDVKFRGSHDTPEGWDAIQEGTTGLR